MMPGIIISCIFNEQGKLIFRAAPLLAALTVGACLAVADA
jgi:hypothetical protein